MKIKNANFVEKHVEKVILGVAALFLVVIGLLYFARQPYSVTLGPGLENLPPAQVEDEINKLARKLGAQIAPTAENRLPKIEVAQYNTSFRERLTQPIVGVPRFLLPFSGPGLDDELVPTIEGPRIYHLTEVPPPAEMSARPGYAVLQSRSGIMMASLAEQGAEDADERARRLAQRLADNWAALVPDNNPRDFRYVSVGGTFSMKQWRSDLASNAIPESQRIPEEWINSLLLLVDVQLERQTLDPVTGNWGVVRDGKFVEGETQLLPQLPGSVSFRNVLVKPGGWVGSEPEQAVRDIRNFQPVIARPGFAPTAGGPGWRPPDAEILITNEQDRVKLEQLERDIEKIEAEIRKLGGAVAAVTPSMSPGMTPGGGQTTANLDPSGRPMTGPGAGPGTAPNRTSPRTGGATTANQRNANRNATRIAQLNDQLVQKRAERDRLLGIIDQSQREQPAPGAAVPPSRTGPPAGAMLPPGPLTPGMPGPGQEGATYQMPEGMGMPPGLRPHPQQPIAGQAFGARAPGMTPGTSRTPEQPQIDKVKIWAHDLQVKPGATYRYRLRVAVFNPLFQRGELNPDQRKKYFQVLALLSKPGEWSAPVHVDPEHFFFVISATEQSRRARLELWSIFDGAWQPEEFDVSPGDPIGALLTRKVRRLDDQGQEVDQEAKLDLRTNMLCVDVLFDTAGIGVGAKSPRLVYLEQDDGALRERRLVSQDEQDNATRKRLQSEASRRRAIAEASASPAPASTP